jgi:elongation factor Tu
MSEHSDFRMAIEDVFYIRGRGTVVTGIISQGTIKAGDFIRLNRDDYERQVQVTDIEVFLRRTDSAGEGERVGIFLADLAKEEVSRGDVLEGDDALKDDIWWEVEHSR